MNNPCRSAGPLEILRHVLLILCLLYIGRIYGVSLNAPFIYDDKINILDNPAIRLTSLSTHSLFQAAFGGHSPSRPVSMISFAMNYYFHQFDVRGYRVINILIHLLNGWLIYVLFRKIMRFPLFKNEKNALWVPLFTALFWLAHPLQVQSVTYVVQRMNSLCTLFYLSGLITYFNARQSEVRSLKKLWWGGTALFFVLAMGTKEIAATFPITLIICECIFWREGQLPFKDKRTRIYGAITAALILIPVTGIFFLVTDFQPVLFFKNQYTHYPFSMTQRLLTESRVVIYYLSLWVFPHPARLNLDYDFPLSVSLCDPITTLFSILALLSLIGGAVYLLPRRGGISFAILWFLLNLVIESSVIPLEIIYEHRLYLPTIGLSFLTVLTLNRLLTSTYRFGVIGIALLCLLSYWTYARNGVWQNALSLWQDCIHKSPAKARPYHNMGAALIEKGKIDAAIVYYRKALKINPRFTETYNNLGVALEKKGRLDDAIRYYRTALSIDPDLPDIHYNLADALEKKGALDQAVAHYRQALSITTRFTQIHQKLGEALFKQGHIDEALTQFQKALKRSPQNPEIYYNLGIIAWLHTDKKKAIDYLKTALRLRPGYAMAHNNLGLIYAVAGMRQKALHHFTEALRNDPGLKEAQVNLEILKKQMPE